MICQPGASQSGFEGFVAEYVRDHTMAPLSRRKFAAECGEFAAFVAASKGRPARVEDLVRANIHEWMDSLRVAATTVNSKRSSVVALANYAAECGHVAALRRVKKLVVGVDPPEGWTLEEFDRLLDAAAAEPGVWCGVPAGLHWRAGLLIVWDTAVRFGELWAARLADVDLERPDAAGRCAWRVPYQSRKGRRDGRVYRLHPQTVEAIAATLGRGETLFDNPRERLWPFPWRKETVWRHYGRILRRAGLPENRRCKFHCIRRTAESYAAAAMGNQAAADAVGHTLAVAERHYLCPGIAQRPSLLDGLPRPQARPQLKVFSGA